ncbi:hypothetical protein ACQCT6_03935 [Cytobacillus gottheilii]|uniref:Exosortase/archaeosortase family protein n=1 Tax=Cytobacillus gottheilii TaxID=859144 RepID=A0ABX8FCK0_9BACI|nr:hypothetical protein [Cytobacillus gottheilii]QVY61845.1 hypothetical protein J1899_01540 [Cytobacillus gottheilii]
MELLIMCVIAWLTVAIFTFLPYKMSVAANILNYLMIAVVDINKISFLAFHYQCIEISSDTIRFISFIVYRDIIFSFLLLILVNIWFAFHHKWIRFLAAVGTLGIIAILRVLLSSLSIFTYKHWSFIHELLMDVVMLLLTVLIAYMSRKITKGMKTSEKHPI